METLKKSALRLCKECGLGILKHTRGTESFIEYGGRTWLCATDCENVHVFALCEDGAPRCEEYAALLAHVCETIAANAGVAAGNALCEALVAAGCVYNAISIEWQDGNKVLVKVERVGRMGAE